LLEGDDELDGGCEMWDEDGWGEEEEEGEM
jgi:hypothetical protein